MREPLCSGDGERSFHAATSIAALVLLALISQAATARADASSARPAALAQAKREYRAAVRTIPGLTQTRLVNGGRAIGRTAAYAVAGFLGGALGGTYTGSLREILVGGLAGAGLVGTRAGLDEPRRARSETVARALALGKLSPEIALRWQQAGLIDRLDAPSPAQGEARP